ncbi:MAG TPA: hypothetical protein ENN88_02415 [Candidatus Coatesbacteria bacterium]|nr:hypothetical protein [Candidatus Coatesbacteria bacterium]
MRFSRGVFLFLLLAAVLLGSGCTDPIANGPYQDQNQPSQPTRVMVYPPYDPIRHPEYPGVALVYREWVGGQPVPLDKPYITMYHTREQYYSGFKVWRRAKSGGNWTDLTPEAYMVPEPMRVNPIPPENWSDSERRIRYDKPNVDFADPNNVELDFPGYRPDLDGFKGDQNPLDGWDVRDESDYYPYKYFFRENRTFGFVDVGFDVGGMDYEDYRWAVCFVDYSGNMSDPVIVEVE